MESVKGRALHAQAIDELEHGQNFQEALRLASEALAAYEADSDSLGASELLSARSNIYNHMGNKDAALEDAKSAVAKAENSGIAEAQAMPLFDLGKRYTEKEEYVDATDTLKRAFGLPLPERHNRTAVKSDMKAHLAFAQYMTGDKSALGLMDEAITELTDNVGEDKYNRDVWLSGAHMRAATMLYTDEPNTAKTHLDKAKEIVEANPELVLRAKQLEELTSKLAF